MKKKFGKYFYTYHDGVDSRSLAENDSRMLRYQGFGVVIDRDPDYIGPYPWKLWIRKLKGAKKK